jgi:hypothetical protein
MRIGRPASADEIELCINPRPVKRAVRRNNAGRDGFERETDNPVPSRKVGKIVYCQFLRRSWGNTSANVMRFVRKGECRSWVKEPGTEEEELTNNIVNRDPPLNCMI